MKVLPHTRSKIWCSFPPLTPTQFQIYYDVLKLDEAGPSMNLPIEVYNAGMDRYETDTYYHTDIMYKPVIYQGMIMIVIDDFELIGH